MSVCATPMKTASPSLWRAAIFRYRCAAARWWGWAACPFNKYSYLGSETDTYYGEALAIVRMGDGDAMTIAASDGEYSAELTVPAQA